MGTVPGAFLHSGNGGISLRQMLLSPTLFGAITPPANNGRNVREITGRSGDHGDGSLCKRCPTRFYIAICEAAHCKACYMLWCRAISKIRFSVCVRATASDPLFAYYDLFSVFRAPAPNNK